MGLKTAFIGLSLTSLLILVLSSLSSHTLCFFPSHSLFHPLYSHPPTTDTALEKATNYYLIAKSKGLSLDLIFVNFSTHWKLLISPDTVDSVMPVPCIVPTWCQTSLVILLADSTLNLSLFSVCASGS